MKSYVSNTTINFEGFKFYVRPGDILVHDVRNQNSLTVYRNGQLVKVVKQDPLAIEAFVKSKFITEVKVPPPSPVKEPLKKEEPPKLPCATHECRKGLPDGPPVAGEIDEKPKPEAKKPKKDKPPKPIVLSPAEKV